MYCNGWHIFWISVIILAFTTSSLKSSRKLYVKTDEYPSSTLVINVNSSASIVQYQYRENDDSLKSWSIFYEKHMEIFKSIVFGNIELGEPIVTFVCFLVYSDLNKVVSMKEMEGLNQSLFHTTQFADNNLTEQNIVFSRIVLKNDIKQFGEEVAEYCSNADDIYVNENDVLRFSAELKNSNLISAVKLSSSINFSQYPYCKNAPKDWAQGCLCRTNIFIRWYPCDSKMCYINDDDLTDDEDTSRYICGIESCKQRHQFVYLVENLKLCLEN